MNKYVSLALKGVIIGSCMITGREVFGVYDMAYGKSGNRLATNIAGNAVGFVVGRKVANGVASIIDAAIIAYKDGEPNE